MVATERWKPYLVLAGLVAVCYLPMTSRPLLVDAPLQAIPMEWSWSEWSQIWTTNYWYSATGDPAESSEYRPLGSLILRTLASIGSPSTWALHLAAILIHLTNAFCLLNLLLRFQFTPTGALAASALFAVHPIASEAVASVVGMTDMLVTTGLIITVGLTHQWLRQGHGYLLAALFILAAAVPFVKESGIAVTGIALGTMVGTSRCASGRRWALAIAVLLGALVYLGLRHIGYPLTFSQSISDRQLMLNPLLALPLPERILSSFPVLMTYAQLFVWPAKLTLFYGYGAIPLVTEWSDPAFWVPAALLASLVTFGIWRWRQGDRLPGYSIGAAAILYAPISHWVVQLGTNLGERLVYAISVPVCVLLTHLLAHLPRRVAGLLLILTLALCSLRVMVRVQDWHDQESLLDKDLSTYTESLLVRQLAAERAFAQGRLQLAFQSTSANMSQFPDFIPAVVLHAKILSEVGATDAAQALIRDTMTRRRNRELNLTLLMTAATSQCLPSGQHFPEPWYAPEQTAMIRTLESLANGGNQLSPRLQDTPLESIILLYLTFNEGFSVDLVRSELVDRERQFLNSIHQPHLDPVEQAVEYQDPSTRRHNHDD